MKPSVDEFIDAYSEEDGPVIFLDEIVEIVDDWRHGYVQQLIFQSKITKKYYRLLNRVSPNDYNALIDGDVTQDDFVEVEPKTKTIQYWAPIHEQEKK